MKTSANGHMVGWGERIAFGLGDVGFNMSWATLASLMTYFYTDIAGIAAATIGTMQLVSRMFDAFSDMGMGLVVDRTSTRFGKARPWVAGAAIPYAIAVALIFTAPDLGPTGKVIYAFVTYNFLTTVMYTIVSQPYSALPILMTNDQQERAVLNVMRMFCGTFTALVLGYVTLPLIERLGGGARGYQLTAAIYGAIAAVIFIFVAIVVKERIVPVTAKRPPALQGIKELFQNKYWVMVLVLSVLTFMLFGVPGTFMYYCRYILNNTAVFRQMLMATYLSALIAMALVPHMIKRLGKRNTVLVGYVIYMAGSAVLIMNPLTHSWVVAGTFIRGLGFGPMVGTAYAFIPDTVEYGEWKTGHRTEGLNVGAASFGQKVGAGLTLGIIGWTLQIIGYVPNAETQSAETIRGISNLVIVYPMVIYTIAAILLLFYKLDKEYPQIVAELRERAEKGQSSVQNP